MATANIEFWGNTKVNSQYLDWDKLVAVLPNGILFINSSQLPPEGFTESDIAHLDKVAKSKPIILESCKANIISQLTYITQDIELACVRIRPDGCKEVEVLKYADGQERVPKVSKGEDQQTLTEPINIEELEKKLKEDPEYKKNKQELEEDSNQDLESQKEQSGVKDADIKKILSSEPSFIVPTNQDDYYSRLKVFESKNIEFMSRSSSASSVPIPNGIPETSWKYETITLSSNRGPYYWNPYEPFFDPMADILGTKQQEGYVDLSLGVELYALNRPAQQGKYLVITLKGTGVSPSREGHLEFDYPTHRIWIQAGFDIEYGIKPRQSQASGISILRHEPHNANNVIQLSSTTGWSVNVNAGVSSDGPSTSIGYQYTNENTEVVDVSDFEVRDGTNPERGLWEYRLNGFEKSNFRSREYLTHPMNSHLPFAITSSLIDKGRRLMGYSYGFGTEVKIREIPPLGKRVLVPRNQVIWETDLGFNKKVEFYVKATHHLVSMVVFEETSELRKLAPTVAQCEHRTLTLENTFFVDFNKVRI